MTQKTTDRRNLGRIGRTPVSSRTLMCAAATVAISVGSAAQAQWTVTVLHPAGAVESFALGATSGQQVGYAVFGTTTTGGTWASSAASWSPLTAAGATFSKVYAASPGQQVGTVNLGAGFQGSKWSGTTASWVNMTPPGYLASNIFATDGTQQVGNLSTGGQQQAGLWAGTATSAVNLHPPGAVASVCNGVSSGVQVGGVQFGPTTSAALWTGTVASLVNLNPAGATYSRAFAVHSGQQGGEVAFGGANRACIWSGTATSFVDLHPAGATTSTIAAVFSGRQAGSATIGGVSRASVWTGTPGSFEDLSAALAAAGGAWTSSTATGIWSDANTISIVGSAVDTATNRSRAILWTMPTCTAAPMITLQPENGTRCLSGTTTFSVMATSPGGGTLGYVWQIRDATTIGSPWANLPATTGPIPCGGTGSGAPANNRAVRVSINGCSNPFELRCLVSNGCGTTTSDPASLILTQSCPAEFDCSGGQPNVNDIFAFLAAWFDGLSRANFNGVNGIDVQDVFDFLAAWFVGC